MNLGAKICNKKLNAEIPPQTQFSNGCLLPYPPLHRRRLPGLKELQVFRPSNFSISSPFQMADMSQAEDSQTDYEALMGQVSSVRFVAFEMRFLVRKRTFENETLQTMQKR